MAAPSICWRLNQSLFHQRGREESSRYTAPWLIINKPRCCRVERSKILIKSLHHWQTMPMMDGKNHNRKKMKWIEECLMLSLLCLTYLIKSLNIINKIFHVLHTYLLHCLLQYLFEWPLLHLHHVLQSHSFDDVLQLGEHHLDGIIIRRIYWREKRYYIKLLIRFPRHITLMYCKTVHIQYECPFTMLLFQFSQEFDVLLTIDWPVKGEIYYQSFILWYSSNKCGRLYVEFWWFEFNILLLWCPIQW